MEKEILKIDIEIFSSYELPLSNQLKKITGDQYSSQYYEDLFHLGGFIIRHIKTGLVIKCTQKETKNKESMTFSEYVNQKDPERLKPGSVKLDPGDINSFHRLGEDIYISLQISGKEHNYIKTKNSQILYTTDADGNAKNQSVFFLNFNL